MKWGVFVTFLLFCLSCSSLRDEKYSFEEVYRFCIKYIGKTKIEHKGKYYDFDCSSFVRIVLLESIGVDIDKFLPFPTFSRTMDYYNIFRSRNGIKFSGEVRPGDLVFFDNTYDRNGNGKLDDKLTHVGIVVGFDKNTGSIVFVDKSKGKPVSVKFLNLSKPNMHKDSNGYEINSYVRDDIRYKFLSSHVFAGFGILDSLLK